MRKKITELFISFLFGNKRLENREALEKRSRRKKQTTGLLVFVNIMYCTEIERSKSTYKGHDNG